MWCRPVNTMQYSLASCDAHNEWPTPAPIIFLVNGSPLCTLGGLWSCDANNVGANSLLHLCVFPISRIHDLLSCDGNTVVGDPVVWSF